MIIKLFLGISFLCFLFYGCVKADTVCDDCNPPYGFCNTEYDNGTCAECKCPKYFSGDCCEIEPTDICTLNPCPKSASQNWECTDLGHGQRSCACEEGFTGAKCDTSIDPCDEVTCFNGGTCSVGGKNGTECICAKDFKGDFCESSKKCTICPCVANAKNCKYGSTCVETAYNKCMCACAPGYTGSKCDTKITCSLTCQHGGVCVKDSSGKDSCTCLSIWTGANCQSFDACQFWKCQNKGTCVAKNDVASCNCVKGYTGDYCEEIKDNCDPNPCQYTEWGIKNETTCVSTFADFTCDCPIGSGGKDCSNNTNDCNPTVRGGKNNTNCNTIDTKATCLDGLNDYRCQCSPDYTGTNCTISMIVWEVAQAFGGLDDIFNLLEEVVKSPSLIKDLMPFLLGQQTPENQSAMSWDYEDLFVWASYEKNELDLRTDIIKTFDTTLGNCFTFNHASCPMKWTSRKSGEDGGFKALMRVRQDQYLTWIDTASLLVFVHPPEETIFAESVRYQASPNTSTTIITEKNAYSRLNGKYGTCVRDKTEVKAYYYTGNYTTAGCFRGCYQDAVLEQCDCMDPRYAMPPETHACNITQWDCVNSITKERGDASTWSDCICPSPCSESQFDSSFTKASFPTYFFPCDLVENDTDKYNYCMLNYTDMVLISVYIPRLTQKVFAETPAMSFNQFISNVGGLAGVFIGFSVITVFDIIFIFVYLTWAACGGKTKQERKDL